MCHRLVSLVQQPRFVPVSGVLPMLARWVVFESSLIELVFGLAIGNPSGWLLTRQTWDSAVHQTRELETRLMDFEAAEAASCFGALPLSSNPPNVIRVPIMLIPVSGAGISRIPELAKTEQ